MVNPDNIINSANPPNAWTLELSTGGGLTGKGLGGIVAGSDGRIVSSDGRRDCQGRLLDGEKRELGRLIGNAKPARWRKSYALPGNPHGYADQIQYTLKLTSGGRTYETSWYDRSAEKLPADLRALAQEAWKVRDRAASECK